MSQRHSLPRLSTLLPLVLAGVVAAGCLPSTGSASSGPPTSREVAQTTEPAPSSDGVTAGEPQASESVEPAPTQASVPNPTPTPEVVAVDPEPFAMNLYREGDFVAQYTFEWCVGASLQMALNMATDDSRTSRADQQLLWEMARDRSFSPFGGANPRGWTASLNDLGIGPYRLVSLPTFDEALNVAAEALRATRRPVGLVMWRGRHAWVMSGFEATADPAPLRRLRGHRHPRPRPAVSARELGLGPQRQAEQPGLAGDARQAVRPARQHPGEPRRAAGLPADPPSCGRSLEA